MFDFVWLSSVAHLRDFEQVLGRASTLAKMFGQFPLPPGFPHLAMYGGLMRVPVVMQAMGQLEVREDMLRFAPRAYSPPLASYRDLQERRALNIDASSLLRVERFELEKPFMKHFNVRWVRVITPAPGLPGDFLLCQGGQGPLMQKVRQGTDAIAAALLELQARGAQGRPQI